MPSGGRNGQERLDQRKRPTASEGVPEGVCEVICMEPIPAGEDSNLLAEYLLRPYASRPARTSLMWTPEIVPGALHEMDPGRRPGRGSPRASRSPVTASGSNRHQRHDEVDTCPAMEEPEEPSGGTLRGSDHLSPASAAGDPGDPTETPSRLPLSPFPQVVVASSMWSLGYALGRPYRLTLSGPPLE